MYHYFQKYHYFRLFHYFQTYFDMPAILLAQQLVAWRGDEAAPAPAKGPVQTPLVPKSTSRFTVTVEHLELLTPPPAEGGLEDVEEPGPAVGERDEDEVVVGRRAPPAVGDRRRGLGRGDPVRGPA